ncbi:MAG: alpha/beta fold hydrolase [Planctomycetota bacterium]
MSINQRYLPAGTFLNRILLGLAILACLSLMAHSTFAQEKTAGGDREVWTGTLQAGPTKLRLDFVIETDQAGKMSATMISIDQGGVKIAVETVEIDANSIKMTLPQIAGSFEGKLNEAGDECEGTWKQGPASLPLTIKRKAAAKPTAIPKKKVWEDRPQRPKEPFPYLSTDVTIKNNAAGMELAGTLTMPKSDKPVPAIVLVSGSGPQDRDETLMGHKPFLVIADHLSRNGIAVVRYDDRGVGKSTGNFAKCITDDFASDTQAVVEFLATQQGIDSTKIGILGHSEGGIIAPMVANQTDKVAFNILLAGPGVDGATIINSQSKAIAAGMGASPEQLALSASLNKRLFKIIRDNQDQEDIKDALLAEFDQWLETLDEPERTAAAASRSAISQFSGAWYRNFIVYDPAPALAKNRCPTLAILGGKDLQVLQDVNQSAIQEALDKNGVAGNELVVFDDANHLFQTAKTGLLNEYETIDQTIKPEVLDKFVTWIKQR